GENVLNLSAGQPDFGLIGGEVNSGISLIRDNRNLNKYPSVRGNCALVKAISENNSCIPESVFISSGGGKQASYMALLALAADENVLVIKPYWVSYPNIAHAVGAKVFYADSYDNGRPNILEIGKIVKENNIRVIIINNPTNPTGIVWKRDELESVGDIAIKNDCYVISDEVYWSIVYDDNKFYPIRSLFPDENNFITVNSFSKSHALMGFRVGYVIADKEIINALVKIQSNLSGGANTFGQEMALISMGIRDNIPEMCKVYEARRKMVLDFFKARGIEFIKPEGAFYLFFKVSGSQSSEDFCKKLLKEKLIALVPGTDFGWDGWVRLSFSVSTEELSSALERMNEFF
ncbi:MAG TPA: aminotransferase class I/II-fold pyridoxal phosphate-dependent enzyme, partial [Bacteroidetes bacterium]|nr:aminotransferase class I/II-fold pyridoxal phosphate-dependent enzyme [Bacteroidota bacterium]